MLLESEQRRVLIASGPAAGATFRQLFARDPLDRWDVLEADTFSRARFVLQHDPCDVLLVNDDLYEREGGQGLSWLAWQQQTPVVFLAGPSAVHLQKAYELGASVCLPRQMALEHPPLLATGMEQALRMSAMRQGYRRARERLSESRRHVDRLVNMMWRTTARQTAGQWFSQRAMLERLSEELARVERHKIPLSLALGEVRPADDVEPTHIRDVGQTFLSATADMSALPTHDDNAEEAPAMPDWTMDVIAKGKRRCDVAGQYGLGGFMLLMVHTPVQGGIHCCRRLQKAIEHAQEPMSGPHTGLHAYFGISATAEGKMSAISLLRAAEQSLEAARMDSRERLAVN